MRGIEGLDRSSAEAALFGGPVFFAPIRHHSPACAWALRQMIRAHRPEVVLIEAPGDLLRHVPQLLDPEARFPLAVVAVGQKPNREQHDSSIRPITFLPFSGHAPETVAIQEAQEIGAEVRFIDLPVNARHLADTGQPAPLQSEDAFDSAAFVSETCRRLGLRDGYELWDHLFESRLGHSDWRGFFADVYAYCAALRASTPDAELASGQNSPREAWMRAQLEEIRQCRAVVVTGGFHTPALLQPASDNAALNMADKIPASESYLIGYGEEELDALSGYAAGLRHPKWYAALWAGAEDNGGPPDWHRHSLDIMEEFAGAEAKSGHRIAVPQLVETLALAQGLARIRGRDAVMLTDLADGVRSALIKGEAHPRNRRLEAFRRQLRGSRLGAAPASAGLPPILHDARKRAIASRFDLSDSLRRNRKLDIRRKPAHAETSRFCHQMQLLGTQFSALISGPDLKGGMRAGLLFEEWAVAWSPQVEGKLIEAARLGATVADAAAMRLVQLRSDLIDAGRGDELPALLDLLIRAAQCGLAERSSALLQALREALPVSNDLHGLAEVVSRTLTARLPGAMLHDLDGPGLTELSRRAYHRFVYLCDDLPHVPEEDMDHHIRALGHVAGCLRNDDGGVLDATGFDRALTRLANAPHTPPLLRGAVTGLMVQAGYLEPSSLAKALRGGLRAVGHGAETRAATLDGLLRVAPALLWQNREILQAAEDVLAALDDDSFLDLLPALRHSLARLNPHETSRLADELAELLGISATGLTTASRFSEYETHRAARADAAMRRQLETEGLGHWCDP